jgi:hypothetical protein
MSPDLTRITFNAIPRTVDDLDHLVTMTALSRTDLLNRAVQIYRFVDEVTREVGGLRLARADGTVEHVRLF